VTIAAGTAKDLTLIVPCYRESSHIEKSVPHLLWTLRAFDLDYEVLFIDDVSPDDTREKLSRILQGYPESRLILNEVNLGRGATVEKGIRLSNARVVGFLDVDLSTQPIYVGHLARYILDDVADVATCQRIYKIDVRVLHKIFHRILMSYGYRSFSSRYLEHHLLDTETGSKFFNRVKILPVLDRIESKHWFWDTEVMVYSQLAGLRIVEVPSIYIRRPEKPTTVKVLSDSWTHLKSAIRLKRKMAEFKTFK